MLEGTNKCGLQCVVAGVVIDDATSTTPPGGFLDGSRDRLARVGYFRQEQNRAGRCVHRRSADSSGCRDFGVNRDGSLHDGHGRISSTTGTTSVQNNGARSHGACWATRAASAISRPSGGPPTVAAAERDAARQPAIGGRSPLA